MKQVKITKASQIKLGQRYRSRYVGTDNKYLYFDVWIEKQFYLNGYILKTKFLFKNSPNKLSDSIKYSSLEDAKKDLHFAFFDKDFNTVWEI